MNNQTPLYIINSNPVYQPIQTPQMTKYSQVFSSVPQNTGIETNQSENIINDRISAQFGQNHSRQSSRGSMSERELRDVVRNQTYVACFIF